MQVMHLELIAQTNKHSIKIDSISLLQTIIELFIFLVYVCRDGKYEVGKNGRL